MGVADPDLGFKVAGVWGIGVQELREWRSYPEDDYVETSRDVDRENCISAREHATVVRQQSKAEGPEP